MLSVLRYYTMTNTTRCKGKLKIPSLYFHLFSGIKLSIISSFVIYYLTLSGPGGAESAPLRFFLHNSKTPADIEKKLSDFNFTPLMDILRILSITIVVRCCHSNLLFPVCHVIFGLKKQRNLNYFQDNYLIKLKFGTWGYF